MAASLTPPAALAGPIDPGAERGPLPRRTTLTDDVYDALMAMIMDHVIAPGVKLSIDGLARTLGVSRTPIRESLARLESDQLVTKIALRGYTASPMLTHAEFEDLFEFRLLVEPWAAGRAAANLDNATDRRRISEEIKAFPSLTGGSDYEAYKALTAHDRRFHELIFDLAGNSVTAAAFERTRCHLHLFRLYFSGSMITRAKQEHTAIAKALRSRDSAQAEQLMRDHITASRDRLRQAFTGVTADREQRRG